MEDVERAVRFQVSHAFVIQYITLTKVTDPNATRMTSTNAFAPAAAAQPWRTFDLRASSQYTVHLARDSWVVRPWIIALAYNCMFPLKFDVFHLFLRATLKGH